MRVWQIAGRVDEMPKAGDWKQYKIYDQSFVIVRGKDEKLRGFVNACRHRGNILCNAATGNAKRGFLCQYHLWSYDLEGKLRGVLRADLAGQIDKSENSLLKVSVDTFGGFIFLNPDPDAHHWPSSSAPRSPTCSRRTTSTRWSRCWTSGRHSTATGKS